jgi:predicted PurR-regulated permease PerM
MGKLVVALLVMGLLIWAGFAISPFFLIFVAAGLIGVVVTEIKEESDRRATKRKLEYDAEDDRLG